MEGFVDIIQSKKTDVPVLDEDGGNYFEGEDPQEEPAVVEEVPEGGNLESVGEDDDNDDEGIPNPDEGGSSQVFSSIASALRDDGIFSELSDEDVKSIKGADDFSLAIEKVIQARLDDKQKRIDRALSAGVDQSVIQVNERALEFLHSIKKEKLEEESDEADTLRKQIIFQDLINRGYSQQKAEREVNKSLNAGTDIEDAIEALQSNLEYFTSKYDEAVKEQEEVQKKHQDKIKKDSESLKKLLLDEKGLASQLGVSKAVVSKAYDNITKPIYEDKETGTYLTAIQKLEKEDKVTFLAGLATAFTLTDGFKNMSGLVKGLVDKRVRSNLAKIEATLTKTTVKGSPTFVSNNGLTFDLESGSNYFE